MMELTETFVLECEELDKDHKRLGHPSGDQSSESMPALYIQASPWDASA